MAFIGEAALSALFESLFGKFTSSKFELVTEKQVRKEIDNWRTILVTIHAVLADAEEKQMKNQAVKIWLADLQDLAYDVDDILDEFATEALGRKLMKEHRASTSQARKLVPTCCTGLHPSSIMFNNEMMSKIQEITARFEVLAKRKSDLQLRENDVARPMTVPRGPPSTSLVNESIVRGRDKDKKAILDSLFRKDDDIVGGVSVIPIVGMGGIGKTTLAQLVYNDDSIKDHFDLKAWVCVSEEFDVTKITKTILQSITSESCDKDDLNWLQERLKEKLSSKKFLLVLDDVWNENYNHWMALRPPFDAGVPGSKIIVTTRNSKVSSIMRSRSVEDCSLQCLSVDDSLSMLAHHALDRGDFTPYPKLEKIGLEIVKKCGGLPLATKTIGGLLRSTRVNPDAWKHILESDIWNLREGKSDIIPALQLSYYYLPSQLKQCFAYCSIIPKDYEFKEEEVVRLWMAEGFLNGANNKREMDYLGRKNFEELVSRSFFQASSKNKSQFVMHDLINDLAQSVGGEIYFKRERDEATKQPSRTRHFSYVIGEHDGIKKFETFFGAKSLRTFLSYEMMMQDYDACYLSNNVLNDLLPRLKCLRVFSLKRYHITEIPSSIGNLKHLCYLDFSYTVIKGLPDSISTLYNLETLLLRCCKKIEKLPSKMEMLDNLCYLDIHGAKSMKEMPSGIGKLTNLLSLSNFIVGQGDGLNIREMKNLPNLKGQLSISELQNVTEVQFAREAELSCKSELDELKLKWSTNFNENLRKKEVERRVLNLLQPHEELKVLAINNYAGIAFPIWIEDPSFKKLRYLKFDYCRNCRLLPAVGKLPLLKDLFIKGMSSIISVGNEFYGENWSNVFPSLETLHFEDMREWKEWKPCDVGEQDRKFYCLRELFIKSCPKLVGTLPDGLHRLERLVISNCEELVVSVSNLPMLCELEIVGCKEVVLGSYDDLWTVKKISLLKIAKFSCVTKDMRMLESMKVEDLRVNGCEELASLWQTKWGWLAPLKSLRNLEFENCAQVVSMGTVKEEEEAELLQLDMPCNIEQLRMWDCEGLEKLSKTLHNLTCLRELKIGNCPKLVSLLTDSLPPTLKSLYIFKCENLQCLFDDGENINFRSTSLLETIRIVFCKALKSLSSSGTLPVRLKSLTIWNCPEVELGAQEIGDNTCLESINIYGCENIKHLPHGHICISTCPNLVCFSESGLPTANLLCLTLLNCENLEALPNNLHSLQALWIGGCPRVTAIPEGGLPTNLISLEIYGPYLSKAVMEWGLHRLTSLEHLGIDGSNFMDAASFQLPPSLTSLTIRNFKNLRKLSSYTFQNLTSLQSLEILHCPKLKSLPKKEVLPSLLQLHILFCPLLKKRCKRGKGKQWSNIAHIPEIRFE